MEAGSNPVRLDSHWNEEVTFLLITEECDTDTLVWFLVTFCIDTLRIPKEVQKNLICDVAQAARIAWQPIGPARCPGSMRFTVTPEIQPDNRKATIWVDVSPIKNRDFPASQSS